MTFGPRVAPAVKLAKSQSNDVTTAFPIPESRCRIRDDPCHGKSAPRCDVQDSTKKALPSGMEERAVVYGT
jgi:hypothetical protein